jgi:hypothetical protein
VLVQNCSRPMPLGLTAPMPVMTTRLRSALGLEIGMNVLV